METEYRPSSIDRMFKRSLHAHANPQSSMLNLNSTPNRGGNAMTKPPIRLSTVVTHPTLSIRPFPSDPTSMGIQQRIQLGVGVHVEIEVNVEKER